VVGVKIACHLREIRGRRSLRDLAELAGVNRGTLSMIENGRMLPKDDFLEGIERAYGAPPEAWYPPRVLLAIIAHDEDEA